MAIRDSRRKTQADYRTFLNPLVLVMGKNTVNPADKQFLSEAISSVIFKMAPDSIGKVVSGLVTEREVFKASLTSLQGQEFIDKRIEIQERNKQIIQLLEPFTGYAATSLEASILAGSLTTEFPASFNDDIRAFARHNEIISYT